MRKKPLMVDGVHDFERRGCSDCANCVEHVECWCVSQEAYELRGTKKCGMTDCPFWEPCVHIDDLESKWYKKLFYFLHNPLQDYREIHGKEEK